MYVVKLTVSNVGAKLGNLTYGVTVNFGLFNVENAIFSWEVR